MRDVAPGFPRPGDRVLVATRSIHKLRELRELLADFPLDLVSLDEMGIEDEVTETGRTFETNARLKATAYARLSGLPTLADDSGLEVDALGGGPGVRTRRYAGERASDRENNAKLLRALRGLPPEQRRAHYVCVLALALPRQDGSIARLLTARGTCRGRIALSPKGAGGFGYDPIFLPDGESRTVAELGNEWKALHSHRALAARALSRQAR